jgi:hypothetical protein
LCDSSRQQFSIRFEGFLALIAYSGPPAKRHKGNPVITRYDPPPGYQAPQPGQPSFAGQNQFQTSPQGYQQQQSWQQQSWQQQTSPQGYQPPNAPPQFQQGQGWQPQQPGQYGQQPNYQNQQYPQNSQYGAQGYQNSQGYQQQQARQAQQWQQGQQQQQQQQQYQQPGRFNNYQAGPGAAMPQGGYQPAQQGWQGAPAQNAQHPTGDASQGQQQQFQGPQMRQNSTTGSVPGSATSKEGGQGMPSSLTRQSSVKSFGTDNEQATAGASVNPNDPLNLAADEWEFDGEGALWPKPGEPTNQALSIGIISKFSSTTHI